MLLSRVLSSSTFRFTFAYAVYLGVAAFLLLASFYTWFSWNTFSRIDDELRAELASLVGDINQEVPASGQGVSDSLRERLETGGPSAYFYLLADASYKKIAGNLESWPEYTEFSSGWLSFQLENLQSGNAKRDYEFSARTAELDDGTHVLVARDTSLEIDRIRFLLSILLGSTFLTISLGAIGGAYISSRMLSNMDPFNNAIRSILVGNLSQRLPVKSYYGDYRELAENTNSLLDRIQALMAGVRQVSDNIAHDLRTPLTRIRSHLSELQSITTPENHGVIERVALEADDLLATFNAALKIAQIETGNRRSELYQLDLSVIIQDVLELYEPLILEKGLALNVDIVDAPKVLGDRDLIFQAIANLLDNALKYSGDTGAIAVRLLRRDDFCELQVTDKGIGISEEDRHRVFERFFRVESSRSEYPGNGLGLSLVAAVVKYHHGTIALLDNNPGLRVHIDFPVHE